MREGGRWSHREWRRPGVGSAWEAGLGTWVPGLGGMPPLVTVLLVLCLILGAGYLGWRQAVTPAAPAGKFPPARGGWLVAASGAEAAARDGAESASPEAAVGGAEGASPPAAVQADKPEDRAERIARWRRAAEAVVAARGGSRARAGRGAAGLAGAFVWPVEAPISSPFGPRWGRNHNGIDLAADHGELIRASRAGEVWLAGPVEGYGLTVVIGHDDGTRTLYAHASSLLVEAGDRVEQGQPIARVGSTGRSTGPHLHFEIIVDDRPVDPLDYLPPQP